MDCTRASRSSTDAIWLNWCFSFRVAAHLNDRHRWKSPKYCLHWDAVCFRWRTLPSHSTEILWHHSCTVYCWQHTVYVPFRIGLNKWRHLESIWIFLHLCHILSILTLATALPGHCHFITIIIFYIYRCNVFINLCAKMIEKVNLFLRFCFCFLFRTTQMF